MAEDFETGKRACTQPGSAVLNCTGSGSGHCVVHNPPALQRMERRGIDKSFKNGPALAGHRAQAVRDAIAETIMETTGASTPIAGL